MACGEGGVGAAAGGTITPASEVCGGLVSGFQPSGSFLRETQAFGLGWDMSGRWPSTTIAWDSAVTWVECSALSGSTITRRTLIYGGGPLEQIASCYEAERYIQHRFSWGKTDMGLYASLYTDRHFALVGSAGAAEDGVAAQREQIGVAFLEVIVLLEAVERLKSHRWLGLELFGLFEQ